MQARHARRRPLRTANRRKLVWATTDTGITVAANTNTTNIDLLAGYKGVVGAASAGITVMRTHIQIFITSTVTNGDSFRFGLLVDDLTQIVTSSASALAINPFTAAGDDWMFLTAYHATPTYGEMSANNNIHIDVKSKRRMEEIQMAYLACFSPVGVAAGGLPFTANLYVRTLLALP
jgi:hypothetical protein